MEKKQHTTASGEDYLEAILVLQKKLGMVRSVDVARHMEVSKPARLPKKSMSAIAFLPSSLSPQALTQKLRRPMPVGLNTLSAMRAFHG